MTNETKHTPTPWKAVCNEIYYEHPDLGLVPVGCLNGECSYQEDESNAAHIVKCVNMHDELVEALLRMKQWCEDEVGAELPCSSIDDVLKKARGEV